MPAPNNNSEQLVWLRRHVENDVPEAIHHLGSAYRDGDYGLVKSAKKAAKIFKRAVELGSVEAMIDLGVMYTYGHGIKINKKKALELYRTTASLGDPIGQYNLSLILQEASGDLVEAQRLLERSAAQGYADAQFGLACMLDEQAVESSDQHLYQEAFRYFKLAAEAGHSTGAYNLAICFEQGDGTPVDLAEAAKWYASLGARSHDAKGAQEALGRVRLAEQRAEIAAQL